jgi:serine phosphatase RsbU (regulator of sigma subunit)
VVEDDDGDALLVEENLADALPDAAVVRVSSLSQAEPSLEAGMSCVLLDLGLPDTEGIEGVERLRRLDPGVAIVVLTGADDAVLGIRAVAAGAQDYLVKGQSDHRVLGRSILYAVERQRAEQSALRLLDSERRQEEVRRMERALLPRPVLRSDAYELSVIYRPGSSGATLGGDFYDAVETADGGLRVVIGDVSGHGPDEAALGASLRSAWRSLVLADLPTPILLATLDQQIRTERQKAHVFVTAAMVEIEPDRRNAVVTLAGHPAPFLLFDRVREFEPDARGPILGFVDDGVWPANRLVLPEEWGVMLFTDGLIEGHATPDGPARLGEAAAVELVARHRHRLRLRHSGAELVDAVANDVEARNGVPLSDDLAICVVEGQWR